MHLSTVTAIFGAVLVAIYGVMAAAPERARTWLAAFPRSRSLGWALTALAVAWSAFRLYETPLGMFEQYKQPWLYVAAPATFFVIVLFVDDLLAPRALGGLLLLFPSTVFDAARFHPSPFRYVMIVLAYAMVIKGMALMLSPYLFRKAVALLLREGRTCRFWGVFGLGFGVLLILLGLFVY